MTITGSGGGDFAYVDEAVPGIRWDAKYATWDNFTGKPLDGYGVNRVVGTLALCAALGRARDHAADLGFGLLLWDGYRPQRAVDGFVRWARQPEDGRTKSRHYPNLRRTEMFERGYVARKSGHSRGSTVDLTLFHLGTGELASMGGHHDLMDPVSHHGARGIAPDEAVNREALRAVMDAAGFAAYPCEWWHYTLRDEPYPDTYFDFAIEDLERMTRFELATSTMGTVSRSERDLPVSGWTSGADDEIRTRDIDDGYGVAL